MRSSETAILLLLVSAAALAGEFPAFHTADIARAAFHTHGDLPSLLKAVGSGKVVRLRVFTTDPGAAGSIRTSIAEAFRRRSQPLPALTIVGVGAARGGAVWESISEAPRTVNPHGLAFISGQPASAPEPSAPLAPLAEKSVAAIDSCLRAAGTRREDVLRVTCLMSSLSDAGAVKGVMERAYPRAAASYIQLRKTATGAIIECEAVARLRSAPPQPFSLVQPPDLSSSPNYSHVALLGPSSVVLTSAHAGRHESPRAVFDQLAKTLDKAGASIRRVAMSGIYPTSREATDVVRQTRFDFYDRQYPPASTMLPFESLPDNASFAIELIAPAR